MHRRRKYAIEEAMKEYPVALFLFDILYIDGSDLTLQPYLVRRRRLEEVIKRDKRVRIAHSITTSNPEELERFFEKAIETGCEGLVCKSVAKDAVYQAGTRGWLWIKYKRDYKSDLTDSVDLVVVGAFHGRGKRAGTYGALLLAAYAPEQDIFQTVTKCGTGFTDEDLRELPKKMKAHHIPLKHPRVHSKLEADVWFRPEVVIEVRGAEITLSPVHLCAVDVIRAGSGLAIRFPRFTGNYRLDKAAEDATSAEQIVGMYRSRLKKLGG
jgi:DNA ligase-1